MTRVCFVGGEDVTLQYELLSRETSREALSTYDLRRPFENSIAVRTVSLGAAMALCNDLQWYIVRFVDTVLIQDPSVSETEWLSRSLAEGLRNDELQPADTGEYLKIYGVEYPEDRVPERQSGRPPGRVDRDRDFDGNRARSEPTGPPEGGPADSETEGDSTPDDDSRGRLVEPLYVRRTDGEIPTYDLRDVSETLVVRLTEDEYAP